MSVGKIEEFKIQTDDWRLYIERLEQYFLANKISNELKVPILISAMGGESYKLLVSLCFPARPSEKTFEVLTAEMERHLHPKPSALAERYKFRNRKQANNESISEYVATLKIMSKTCEFGPWLEESLRDQLVCGISRETIRQRLFVEENLDFAKACSLAVSMAAAEKDVALVEGSYKRQGESALVDCQVMAGAWQRNPRSVTQARPGQSVSRGQGMTLARHLVLTGHTGSSSRQCTVCGGSHGQAPAQCKFARCVCHVCNREGHLRHVCPNLKAAQHNVEVSADTDTDEDQRQTLMFSASSPEDIQHLAGRFLNNSLLVAVGIVGGASTDVEQIFHQVAKYEKQNALKKLIEENDGKRILVFVETKRNADFTAAMLSEQQMLSSSIHGGRMQREREMALQKFKSGARFILVATAAAVSGLDIKNVDIVVNYDLPKSINEYVHRIGRTSRVGNRGKAVSFFDGAKDAALVADLVKILRQADQPIPDFLQGGGIATYRGNKYGGSDV